MYTCGLTVVIKRICYVMLCSDKTLKCSLSSLFAEWFEREDFSH